MEYSPVQQNIEYFQRKYAIDHNQVVKYFHWLRLTVNLNTLLEFLIFEIEKL